MKYISKILLAMFVMTVGITACNKVDDLPNYGATTGSASVLSASKTTLAALPADSSLLGIVFSWTNPKYATDSATQKFVLEIDSSGRNFSKAVTRTIIGALGLSFTNKEMNDILLGFGFQFNVAYDVDVRLTTSYGNNNEKMVANTLKIKMTPYKVPPKIALPTTGKLWINGGACTWSWTGNPPTPQSEFSRINNETWAGVFNLSSGNEFLVLGQNGGTSPYDLKYAVPNNTVPNISAGGAFGFFPPGANGDNFKSPGTSGWYKMKMDFQSGTFNVSSFGSNAMPQDLYITGDGTTSGWVNNPPANQKLTRVNSCEYTITLALTPGKFFKFLSVSGQWQPQFGLANNISNGNLSSSYVNGVDADNNIPTPNTAGTYKITVNFATNSYTIQ